MVQPRNDGAGDTIIAGTLLLMTGLTFAALAGAVMKLLAQELPIALIVWFRFAGFFALLLPIAAFRFGAAVVRPSPLWLQVTLFCLFLNN